MIYCFDLDGTICTLAGANYLNAEPRPDLIKSVRELSASGDNIIIYTARGTKTGIDWGPITESQLKKWKVPYDELIFGKPDADLYVDDKAVSCHEFEASQ